MNFQVILANFHCLSMLLTVFFLFCPIFVPVVDFIIYSYFNFFQMWRRALWTTWRSTNEITICCVSSVNNQGVKTSSTPVDSHWSIAKSHVSHAWKTSMFNPVPLQLLQRSEEQETLVIWTPRLPTQKTINSRSLSSEKERTCHSNHLNSKFQFDWNHFWKISDWFQNGIFQKLK